MEILFGILLPFLGTSIGASLVFFIKNKINDLVEKILYGFASGIMIAASFWSLILPSLEMSKDNSSLYFIPSACGLFLGIACLFFIKHFSSRIDRNLQNEEKILKKKTMIITAITLHNIPEGMAVGVIFASFLNCSSTITYMMSLSLSIGVAIQNIPEGAIVSIPALMEGKGKVKSFLIGVVSGLVEPIAAFITILMSSFLTIVLPYLLAFAAGAMIYVVVDELIPEAYKTDRNSAFIFPFILGFILMMTLDVMLG